MFLFWRELFEPILSSPLLNSPISLVRNSAVAGPQPGWERRRETHPEHTGKVSKVAFSTWLEPFPTIFQQLFYLKNFNNFGTALLRHHTSLDTALARHLINFSTAVVQCRSKLDKNLVRFLSKTYTVPYYGRTKFSKYGQPGSFFAYCCF